MFESVLIPGGKTMANDGPEKRTSRHTWPKYPPATADYIYAIGVLARNHNELESSLLDLLKLYGEAPEEVTSFVFEKVPTNVRIEWLKKTMDARGVDTKVRAAIEHFIKAYSTCTNSFTSADPMLATKPTWSRKEQQGLSDESNDNSHRPQNRT
jgi:hypothetical protein